MEVVGGPVRANRRRKQDANDNGMKDGTVDNDFVGDVRERSVPSDKTRGTGIEGVNKPPAIRIVVGGGGGGEGGGEGRGRDKQIK